MSTPEICNMMILSTAHIAEEDNDLLCSRESRWDGEKPLHITHAPAEYGYFVWTGTHANLVRESGFSSAFLAVLEYARDRGCRYLYLDRDGESVDDLPTFNW